MKTWEEVVKWRLAQPEMAELAKGAYFGDPVIVARRYRVSAEYAALQRMLPQSSGRALDLEAGNGILSWAGAIRALAQKTEVPLTVIEAMGEDIPLGPEGFDLVVARQVLHHIDGLPAFAALRASWQLLRSGTRDIWIGLLTVQYIVGVQFSGAIYQSATDI